MKPTTNSVFDLEDLALETGSTLEYPDGRKFNSGKLRATRKPAVPPAAAPEPMEPSKPEEPEPPHPEVVILLKQLIAAVQRPVAVTMPPIPAPQVTVKAPDQKASSPKAWTFDFERNSNGTIKRINATVKE